MRRVAMKQFIRYLACLAALLITSTAVPAAAQDAALGAAVDAYDSSLRLPDDGSLVQWADFTGDGRPDVAAVLSGGQGSSLVIFNARPGGFQAHPLYTRLPSGPIVIRLVLPGWHRVLGPSREVELLDPTVELVFPGRSSAIYAWRNGRYHVFPTEGYH